LRNIYQKLSGSKIDSTFYNKYYCRKDGFIAILNLIEVYGYLEQAMELFKKTLQEEEESVVIDLFPDS
jgi:hypothetical protein